MFAKRAKKISRESTETAEIELGNDLSRVLPQELAGLGGDPVRRRDFFRRYMEGKLLQYRLDCKHPEGHGPIVICIDESGSMSGSRNMWAKAVALAMLMLAAKEKRAFALIHFGSKSELKVDYYQEPRNTKPSDILRALAFFFGGGTDFERPLQEAEKILAHSPYRKGDVIFITDGECYVGPSFLRRFAEAKQEKQFSVFALLLQQHGGERSVKQFADRVYRVITGKNDCEILEYIAG